MIPVDRAQAAHPKGEGVTPRRWAAAKGTAKKTGKARCYHLNVMRHAGHSS